MRGGPTSAREEHYKQTVNDLRCMYCPKYEHMVASKWLSLRIEVPRRVENDSGRRAQLMKVSILNLLEAATDSQRQIGIQLLEQKT